MCFSEEIYQRIKGNFRMPPLHIFMMHVRLSPYFIPIIHLTSENNSQLNSGSFILLINIIMISLTRFTGKFYFVLNINGMNTFSLD